MPGVECDQDTSGGGDAKGDAGEGEEGSRTRWVSFAAPVGGFSVVVPGGVVIAGPHLQESVLPGVPARGEGSRCAR